MTTRRELLAALGATGTIVAGASSVGGAVPAAAGTAADDDTADADGEAARRRAPEVFATDFEFPADRLDERGWTVRHGSFRTADSHLVADGEADNLDYQLSRPQPQATGTFRFRGVQNREPYYGLKFAFVSDGPSFGEPPVAGGNQRGYQLAVRNEANSGRVDLTRSDGDGSERLVTLTEDHGGREMDVRIERDPETWRFDCYLDGEHVGSAVDDTYTGSSFWVQKHGAGDSQRVDAVAVRAPGGGGQLEAATTADRPATRTAPAGDGPPALPTDWLAGWAPLLAWLAGVPVVGPLVLGALVALVERGDESEDA
jgi:hypothetical protein